MVKLRLIGVLVVKAGIVVQSIGFSRYLPIGSPEIAIEYLNRWGIDEIILLDIDATPQSRAPRHRDIARYAKHCHVPLSVGGGITTVAHIEQLIRGGADKVAINSAAMSSPALMTEGAKLFGSQCIIMSLDARELSSGTYEVVTDSGSRSTGMTPGDAAKMAEESGAGEIMVNSIDRDGTKAGYDRELVRQVVESVSVPVIVCGGVGHPSHFVEICDLNVSGVAAANIFHYTEHSVIVAKSYLQARGAAVRLDTYATYGDREHDAAGRVAKLDDHILEQRRFEYIPEEVI